jgi:hypothetical protein
MTRHILYAVLFCLGSVSFVASRVYVVRNRETPHFEIVKDPSASHGGGCESLVGLAGQVLEANAAGPGSTITVLVLGDRSTAGQPWRMGTYSVPSVRKVLEGRSAKLRQQQQILRDISGKCQVLRRTTISPIFLGVTQAAADLHARGCKPTSHCELFVDTDLEENVEPAIRKALLKNDGPKHIPLSPVDNTGIGVVFCGVAVTDGRVHDRAENAARQFVTRDSDRVKRTQEIWRSLFAEPKTVRFEPYCPSSTELERSVPSVEMNRHGETDASQ